MKRPRPGPARRAGPPPADHARRRYRARGHPGRAGRRPVVARLRPGAGRRRAHRRRPGRAPLRHRERPAPSASSSPTRKRTPTSGTPASTCSWRPDVHGQGLGPDAIRLLAAYLIDVRGHHRLTIDPVADNAGRHRGLCQGRFPPRRRDACLPAHGRRHLGRRVADGAARHRAGAMPDTRPRRDRVAGPRGLWHRGRRPAAAGRRPRQRGVAYRPPQPLVRVAHLAPMDRGPVRHSRWSTP